MDIAGILSPDQVVAGLKATTKTRLLDALARRAAAATGLEVPDIVGALIAREALGSTGVGAGVAIPHARFAALDRFFGVLARLDHPIDYDAIDGQPVDLVFLLLIPTEAVQSHLQALAAVSRRLRDPDLVARLRKAGGPEPIHALFVAGNGSSSNGSSG